MLLASNFVLFAYPLLSPNPKSPTQPDASCGAGLGRVDGWEEALGAAIE